MTTLAISHLEEILEKFHNSFHVYTDLSAAGNHFTLIEKIYSQEDQDKVNIDMGYKLGCYSGDTCIKAEFSPNLIGNNWGGYYFMNGILEANDSQPKPNWGDYPDAGFDLRGAKEITFFAKGEEG